MWIADGLRGFSVRRRRTSFCDSPEIHPPPRFDSKTTTRSGHLHRTEECLHFVSMSCDLLSSKGVFLRHHAPVNARKNVQSL